jgi:hypothetical protein
MMSRIQAPVAVFLVVLVGKGLLADNAQTTSEPPQTRSGKDVKQHVTQLQPGTFLDIRFQDGSKARGYLTQVDADGFSFRTGDPTTGDQHRTTFSKVKSIKVVKQSHTPAVAWILTGAVIGAVVIALVVFLIAKHNG